MARGPLAVLVSRISVLAQVDSCCNLGTPRCFHGIASSKVVLYTVKIGPPHWDRIKSLYLEVRSGPVTKSMSLPDPVTISFRASTGLRTGATAGDHNFTHLPCLCCFALLGMMAEGSPRHRAEQQGLNGMTSERVFTVPEVARFFGITPQAVRQRIVEGRLQASKVRVKGIAREYRISGGADSGALRPRSDADMRRLASETVRYRVGFMEWGLGLPFPDYQPGAPYLR